MSWCQIPQDTFRDVVESMPRRVSGVWQNTEDKQHIRHIYRRHTHSECFSSVTILTMMHSLENALTAKQGSVNKLLLAKK